MMMGVGDAFNNNLDRSGDLRAQMDAVARRIQEEQPKTVLSRVGSNQSLSRFVDLDSLECSAVEANVDSHMHNIFHTEGPCLDPPAAARAGSQVPPALPRPRSQGPSALATRPTYQSAPHPTAMHQTANGTTFQGAAQSWHSAATPAPHTHVQLAARGLPTVQLVAPSTDRQRVMLQCHEAPRMVECRPISPST